MKLGIGNFSSHLTLNVQYLLAGCELFIEKNQIILHNKGKCLHSYNHKNQTARIIFNDTHSQTQRIRKTRRNKTQRKITKNKNQKFALFITVPE